MLRGLSPGLLISIVGCIIPVMVLYFLFFVRALGAGDIKLLSVAGAFVGADVLRLTVYSFLAGGVISVIYLIRELILHRLSGTGRAKGTAKQSITIRNIFSKTNYIFKEKRRVHFSVAILCGVLYYMTTL